MKVLTANLLFFCLFICAQGQQLVSDWWPSFTRKQIVYSYGEKDIAIRINDSNPHVLLPEMKDSLLVLSKFLKARPEIKIEIIRYDIPQSIPENAKLVAIRIRELLVADGVSEKRISIRSQAIKKDRYKQIFVAGKEDDMSRYAFLMLDYSPYYPAVSSDRKMFSFNDSISTLSVGDVRILGMLFVYGKCDFYPEFADSLNLLVDFLQKNPYVQVELGVHTDSRGSRHASVKYPQCRAEAVKKYLVEKGISPNQLVSVGYGESLPIISDDVIAAAPTQDIQEEYHRMNRRVEVKILSLCRDNRVQFSYTNKKTIVPGAVRRVGVLFEFAKRTFYPQYTDSLMGIVQFLKQNPTVKVEIGVHTDTRVSDESSTRISVQRARVIGEFLKKNGVPETQFNCMGHEKGMPIVPESVINAEPSEDIREKYHAINRRVELRIISVE